MKNNYLLKSLSVIALLLLINSCNTEKAVKRFACIEKVEYIEFGYDKQPVVIIDIKVNDSSISQKLKNMELRGLRINSVKKEDRNYFLYDTLKTPIKKGNTFSFLIRTSYFLPNIEDKEQHKERIWKEENIKTALSGDIVLIFDKYVLFAEPCENKKITILMAKD